MGMAQLNEGAVEPKPVNALTITLEIPEGKDGAEFLKEFAPKLDGLTVYTLNVGPYWP